MKPAKPVTVEVRPAEGPVVLGPALDDRMRARERPAIPHPHVGDRRAGRILVGRQEDVCDPLVEEEVGDPGGTSRDVEAPGGRALRRTS